MTDFAELNGPYATIVADPPWPHKGFAGSVGRGGFFAGTDQRAAVKVKPLPYSSLSLAEIESLPVGDLAAPDAWLFLWTTNAYMQSAFAVAEAWGFTYRQTMVWRKTGNPSPYGGTLAPNLAEFVLVCAWGNPRVVSRLPGSVFEAQKPNQHSLKPAAFMDMVEQATSGPYVELFARAPRLGWDSWGYGFEVTHSVTQEGQRSD